MKNYTIVALAATFILLFFSPKLGATLPQGAIAEDFTLTDIYGDSHNLYDYLDQGYSVALDLSAAWCGPCWNFHQGGPLKDIWTDYGPGGDDMVIVMMIEVAANTNQDCFFGATGCNISPSFGDWSAGVDYHLFNPPSAEANTINSDYQVTVFPTSYMISPSGWVQPLVGAGVSYSQVESWAANSFQMENSSWVVEGDGCGLANIDLTPFQGEGNISYDWSNGETSEDIQNVGSGIYYVTMTDENDYQAEIGPIEVQISPSVVVNQLALGNVDCNGNNTGFITINGSGGSGNFSYNWSNGGNSNSISNLIAGDYNLTLTDEDTGCEVYDSYSISEPEELDIDYDTTDATCFSNNGTVVFDIYGGSLPYTYIIGGVSYNVNEITLQAGTYSAQVEDDNGCSDNVMFTIDQPSIPEAMASATNNIDCINTSSTLNSAGSTTGAEISYFWYSESGSFLGSGSSIEVSTGGIYTLNVFNNDSGCEDTIELNVEGNDLPPLAIATSASQITCNASSVVVSSAGSATGNNITYEWSGPGILGSTTSSDITVNQSGTYALQVNDLNTGCSSITSVIVGQAGTPSLAVPTNTSFCSGSQTTLCVPLSNNETLEWILNGVVISTSSCYQATSADTYTVRLTDTNTGCSVSQMINTTTHALPNALISGAQDFCSGSSTEICHNAESGINYSWTLEGQNFTSRCISVNTTTIVQLQATNISTGCNNTNSISLSQLDNPVASIARPNIIDCSVDNAFLDLTINDPLATVSWNGPNGNVISSQVDITVTDTGTYTAYITDSNGCQTQASTTVISDTSVPQVSIATPTLIDCQNSVVSLEVTSNGTYQMEWIDPNGNTISTDEDISVSIPGNYTLIATNAAGCQTTNSVTVFSDMSMPQLSIAHPAQLSCNISTVTIDLTTGGNYELSWYDSQGNLISNSEDLNVNEPGSYTVIAANELGCQSETTIEVTSDTSVPQVSIIEPMPLDCNNDVTTIFADVSEANSVVWYDENGYTLLSGSVIDASSLAVSAGGTYSVTATNDSGCRTTVSVTVTHNNNAIVDPLFSFVNDELEFQFNDQSNYQGELEYSWDFGDGHTSDEINPVHEFTTAGYYTVCLTTTNECGNSMLCQEILAVAKMTATYSLLDVSCFGYNDGSILLSVEGGLVGYTYEWDSNLNGNDVSGLAPGTYTVIITDQVGTQLSEQFTITEPNAIEVQAEISSVSAGAADGAIDIDVTGGTPEYSFTWSNGATTQNITDLIPGEYSVAITDINGCENIFNYTVAGSVFVSDIDNLLSFNISPNPSSEYINIHARLANSNNVQVSIISMIGERQLLSTTKGDTYSERIDLTNYDSGIYFIELRTKGQVALEKIIISK